MWEEVISIPALPCEKTDGSKVRMGRSRDEAMTLYNEMKDSIRKEGGTFCQYRACNLTVDTIYDLENIKNGVVYARSPLHMNDPFDSMVGFSSEKLYQDFCDMLVSTIYEPMTKAFMGIMLKEKALGKIAEFIVYTDCH